MLKLTWNEMKSKKVGMNAKVNSGKLERKRNREKEKEVKTEEKEKKEDEDEEPAEIMSLIFPLHVRQISRENFY